jgi:hypothetical protein
LRETFSFLRGECTLQPTRGDLDKFFATHQSYDVDFADVEGQGHVKRALEVAVAGGHNILKLDTRDPTFDRLDDSPRDRLELQEGCGGSFARSRIATPFTFLLSESRRV